MPLVLIAVLSAGVLLGTLARTAYAAEYLGAGYFQMGSGGATCRINRDDSTSAWITAISNANSDWSNNTDINTRRVYDDSWHVYGRPGFFADARAGWALIETAGGNNNYANYQWCIAYLNRNTADGYSPSRKQGLVAHEPGHCWSLGHRDDTTSIMGPNEGGVIVYPNTRDKQLVNNRY